MFTTDQITAASNGAWAGGAWLVLILLIKGLWVSRKHGRALTRELILMCAGLSCTSIGVIMHRGYWNLAIFKRTGGYGYADWALDQRYIPSAASVLIISGILIGTWAFGALYFGRARWSCLALAVITMSIAASLHLAA